MLLTSQNPLVTELTNHVMAAELQLTHFSSRAGKDSSEYQDALKSFATAWFLLKRNRLSGEFVKEAIPATAI
jgi:hypothetical protein